MLQRYGLVLVQHKGLGKIGLWIAPHGTEADRQAKGQQQSDVMINGKQFYDWAMQQEHVKQLRNLGDKRCKAKSNLPELKWIEAMMQYPADVHAGRAWIMMQNNALGLGRGESRIGAIKSAYYVTRRWRDMSVLIEEEDIGASGQMNTG